MKYTNYVINGDIIDAECLIVKDYGAVIEFITVTVCLLVSFVGIIFCLCTLPVTLMYDSYKTIIVMSEYHYRRMLMYNKRRLYNNRKRMVLYRLQLNRMRVA